MLVQVERAVEAGMCVRRDPGRRVVESGRVRRRSQRRHLGEGAGLRQRHFQRCRGGNEPNSRKVISAQPPVCRIEFLTLYDCTFTSPNVRT